jgi:hypothetical protein
VLSDRERETLREVEARILNEDPEFARTFHARARRLPQVSTGGVGIKIFVVVGLLLGALLLVAGSLTGALAFVIATALVWLMWRFAGDAGQRSP